MPNLTKQCIICKEEKSEDKFYPNGYTKKDGSKSTRLDCADCCKKRRADYFKDPLARTKINERRRKDYKSDGGQRKSINRKYSLKNLYGLTSADVERMLEAQNHSCKICGLFEGDAPKCRLFIDHCHKTKKVRGLLCQNCNSAIGHLKDNIDNLYAAIEYLSQG
jgi:hypothetical protein